MTTDNIDRYGHCVVCHKNLISDRVVDNQVVKMFSPLHTHTEFLLDNGSRMQVCICKPCKETTDLSCLNKQAEIMEAVNKGWQLEVKALVADEKQPDWTEESGKAYLERMAKLNIDCASENLSNNVIANRIQELTKV